MATDTLEATLIPDSSMLLQDEDLRHPAEGEPGERLYIVISGEVIISKKISPETEKILAVLGPKSVFGETSLFSNVPRTADAKAKTPSPRIGSAPPPRTWRA